jgi:hypothetical protein
VRACICLFSCLPTSAAPCVAACLVACLFCCTVWVQAADRLLLITEALTSNGPSSFLAAGMGSSDPSDTAGGSGSDLHVHHVLLPAAYIAANWPLQHVAVSPCGSDIAAAGLRGLVVYNRKQERWRMFGEVMQVCADCWGLGSSCVGILFIRMFFPRWVALSCTKASKQILCGYPMNCWPYM